MRKPAVLDTDLGKISDLVLSQLLPLASSVVMTFVTAAILGVEGRGELALTISTSSLIGAIGFMNLHVGIVRAFHLGDATALRRGFTLALVLGALLFTMGFLTSLVVGNESVGLFDRKTIFLVTVGGALAIVNLVVLRTKQGLGLSRVFRNACLIQAGLYPVLGIPVALISGSSTYVVLCWYVAILSSTLFTLVRPNHVPQIVSGESVSGRAILSMSIPAHIGISGQQLLHSADMVVLGFLASAASVGVYSIAVPVASLLWVGTEALSLLAFDKGSSSSSLVAHRSTKRTLVRANLFVSLFGSVLIALASIALIPKFMPEYGQSIPLILILLPGVVIQGYARISISSILTTVRKWPLVVIGVSSALLSFFYFPFVLALGATGAAIGSTSIYAAQSFVVFLVTRRMSHSTEQEERYEITRF